MTFRGGLASLVIAVVLALAGCGSTLGAAATGTSKQTRPTTTELEGALTRFTTAKGAHLSHREIMCIASLIEASPMSDHALRMVASTGTYTGAPLDSLASAQASSFIKGLMRCM